MRRRTRASRRSYVWPVLVVAAAVGFIGLLFAASSRPRLPRVGDHWHARYSVTICGQTLTQFPYTPGNVHTHGDGVIHIHPQTPFESGRNANLGWFFAGAGVEFARGKLELPDGRRFHDGDQCPNGQPGRVRLLVNGKPSDSFEQYVPQNGDQIVVEFG